MVCCCHGQLPMGEVEEEPSWKKVCFENQKMAALRQGVDVQEGWRSRYKLVPNKERAKVHKWEKTWFSSLPFLRPFLLRECVWGVGSYSVRRFPWLNTSLSQERATVCQEAFLYFDSEKAKIIL